MPQVRVLRGRNVRGRPAIILARFLDFLLTREPKVGNNWDGGVTIGEIAEHLYPDLYTTNPFQAKAKARVIIGRVRKLYPKKRSEGLGIRVTAAQEFPFYSTKPTIRKGSNLRLNPLGESRYYWVVEPDDLKKVREQLTTIKNAISKTTREMDKELDRKSAERGFDKDKQHERIVESMEEYVEESAPITEEEAREAAEFIKKRRRKNLELDEER